MKSVLGAAQVAAGSLWSAPKPLRKAFAAMWSGPVPAPRNALPPRLSDMSPEFRRSHRHIARGAIPERYRRVLDAMQPLVGARILEIGGAEGLMASLLMQGGAARVVSLERRPERCRMADRLFRNARFELRNLDILENLHLLQGMQQLVALHCLYLLGPAVHTLFDAVRQAGLERVVLQGKEKRRHRIGRLNRAGVSGYEPGEKTWGYTLATVEGLEALVRRHGLRPRVYPHPQDPIVIGERI